MERSQINIRVEPKELGEWVRRAGEQGLSLSAWIRERCNGEIPKAKKRDGVAELPADGGVCVVAGRTDSPERTAATLPSETCEHHKKRGEVCYKCDPKFGYPAIAAEE